MVFDALIKLIVIPLTGNYFQEKKNLNVFLSGIMNALLVLEFLRTMNTGGILKGN